MKQNSSWKPTTAWCGIRINCGTVRLQAKHRETHHKFECAPKEKRLKISMVLWRLTSSRHSRYFHLSFVIWVMNQPWPENHPKLYQIFFLIMVCLHKEMAVSLSSYKSIREHYRAFNLFQKHREAHLESGKELGQKYIFMFIIMKIYLI